MEKESVIEELIIRMKDVCFSYGNGSGVFKNLSFSIAEGEFVVLVGSNGSGKSTIAKLVDCLVIPEEGTVEVFGTDTSHPKSEKEIRPHVGMILQNPDDQLVSSRVFDEIAFGPANLGIEQDEIEKRVNQAMEMLGITNIADRNVNELSGGQKQRVAIAGALAMNADLLILDEATSMLDTKARISLMETIKELHMNGKTILAITHYVDESRYADRILSLDIGEECIGEECPTVCKQITFDQLQGKAKKIYESFGFDHDQRPNADESYEAPIIEFDSVSFSYDQDSMKNESLDDSLVLNNLSFKIRKGEMVAITGRNGSGKSTALKMMNGLLEPTAGIVKIEGNALSPKKKEQDASFAVGLVFQYPEKQLFATSVYEDIAFGPRNIGLAEDEIDHRVKQALDSVGLAFDDVAHKSPFVLSGGEMRKVAIAGILAMKPKVVALDEPCVSLDLKSRLELLKLLKELNERGTTVIMVTHDKEDIELLGCREIIFD